MTREFGERESDPEFDAFFRRLLGKASRLRLPELFADVQQIRPDMKLLQITDYMQDRLLPRRLIASVGTILQPLEKAQGTGSMVV